MIFSAQLAVNMTFSVILTTNGYQSNRKLWREPFWFFKNLVSWVQDFLCDTSLDEIFFPWNIVLTKFLAPNFSLIPEIWEHANTGGILRKFRPTTFNPSSVTESGNSVSLPFVQTRWRFQTFCNETKPGKWIQPLIVSKFNLQKGDLIRLGQILLLLFLLITYFIILI